MKIKEYITSAVIEASKYILLRVVSKFKYIQCILLRIKIVIFSSIHFINDTNDKELGHKRGLNNYTVADNSMNISNKEHSMSIMRIMR